MAFPTTGILDTFDRANSTTTIGSNWTPFESGATKDRGIISNQAYNPDSGAWSWLYYNVAQYGPDCECYCTVAVWTTSADVYTLMIRLKDVTQDAYVYDGYRLNAGISGTDALKIYRIDDSVGTQLGATVNIPMADGDKIGIRAQGDVLTGWLEQGSGWTMQLERTDSTYAAAGYLGFYASSDTAWRLDNFSGGTIPKSWAPPPRPPMHLLAR